MVLIVGSLTFSLSAQQYRRNRRNRGRGGQTTTVQQKKPEEKPQAKPASGKSERTSSPGDTKFDPKKPSLTQNQIDDVMNNQIREKILECKIPAKLPGSKDDVEDTPEDEDKKPDGNQKTDEGKKRKTTFISRLDFVILMSRYKSLIDNFELIEVSRICPEWYQQYQTELRKFGPLINEMTISIRARSNDRYAAGVEKFKAQQEACLKFLKGKPPRISREQYEALLLHNTKIRRQNYLKRLQEERAAAMQRRQEMLKQKSQPKNPPQNKDGKTAPGAENKKQ